MILKFIYTFFIGLLLALFVGVGISAFYKSPKLPEYSSSYKYPQPVPEHLDSTTSAKLQKEQEQNERVSKKFQETSQLYNRNVSIVAISAAILTLVLSLTLLRNLMVIADGLLLGGVFTLLYSIVRGFESNDDTFRFIVVSIGLFISLFLGYIKFIKPLAKGRGERGKGRG